MPLAAAYAERIELSPINSGATVRRPAHRGVSTFTPLLALSYDEWTRRRGRRDVVLEVTILCAVPDIARHVVDVRRIDRAP